MQLPIKTRMLQYALELDGSFTRYDVENALREEYPDKREFNLKTIDDYLNQLMVVGFITREKVEFENDKDLLITFRATEYGQTRYKYVKGKGPYGKVKEA